MPIISNKHKQVVSRNGFITLVSYYITVKVPISLLFSSVFHQMPLRFSQFVERPEQKHHRSQQSIPCFLLVPLLLLSSMSAAADDDDSTIAVDVPPQQVEQARTKEEFVSSVIDFFAPLIHGEGHDDGDFDDHDESISNSNNNNTSSSLLKFQTKHDAYLRRIPLRDAAKVRRMKQLVLLACFRLACLHGRLDIMKFLYEWYARNDDDEKRENERNDDETGSSLARMFLPLQKTNDCLHLVMMRGHVQAGRFLLEKGLANINQVSAVDNFSTLPLHAAIAFQNVAYCRMLLEYGANVHARDERGDSALHMACQRSSVEIVKMLVQDYQADLFACNAVGRSTLFLATANGHVHVCHYLLQRGVDVHWPNGQEAALYLACEQGNLLLVQLFCGEYGADPWIRSGGLKTSAEVALESTSNGLPLLQCLLSDNAGCHRRLAKGRTLLHCAARTLRPDLIQWLLQQGYSPDIQDDEGNTAAHVVCKHSNARSTHDDEDSGGLSACLQSLHEQGATFEQFDTCGNLPIHVAAKNGRVRPLLDLGASASAQSTQTGSTPLHILCGSEHCRVNEVLALLDHGADVNARDDDGQTPIMCAMGPAQIDIIHCLVQHGADVKCTDRRGFNVIHHLCQVPFESLMGTLEDKKFFSRTFLEKTFLPSNADINQQTELGWTPLHLAVLHARGDLVELLVDFGAEVDCRNAIGHTPLHLVGLMHFGKESSSPEVEVLEWYLNQGSKETAHADFIEMQHQRRAKAYQTMLSRGCDACVSDVDGNLPFFLAASTGWLNATFEIFRAAATQGLL